MRRPAAVAQQRLRRALDVDAVGDDHALVVERQAQRGVVGQRVGQPLDRPRTGPRRSARPDAQRRAENERTSGTSVEMTRPRAASSSRSVARGSRHAWAGTKPHQRRPARRAVSRGGVGRHDAQHAAGAQQTRAAVDRGDRVVEVLEHVGEHDDVEAVEIDEGLDRLLVHVEPQRLAGMARGRARELEPDRLVAARARLVEQQAVPAADVEQAPGGDLLGDQVEQVAGGGAAPGLLAQVGVVAHVAVERVQLVAGRQQRLLHGAALHAREQVAVAAGLVREGAKASATGACPLVPATRRLRSPAHTRQAVCVVAMAPASPTSGRPYTSRSGDSAIRRACQRAPGELGGLLAARVLGAPGQVDLGEPRRGGARGLGEERADDGVAAQVQVAGAAPTSAARPATSAAPRATASGLSAASDIAASRRSCAPGLVLGQPQRLEHRAVDVQLALGQSERLGAQLAGPRAHPRHPLVAVGVLAARERERRGHLDQPRRQRAGQCARRAASRRRRLGCDLFEQLSQRAVGERGHRPDYRAPRPATRARGSRASRAVSRPWAAPGSSSCPRAGREPSPPPQR